MSENLQQVIFYTCILIVFYMIWGATGVIQGALTLVAFGAAYLLWLIAKWAFDRATDPFPGSSRQRTKD
jgi:hypothetical protein